MVGMKSVLPNHPNQEIHERIETNKSIKFSSSGRENKSEEEEARKARQAEKLIQTVQEAIIKQRVENMC